MVKSKEWKKTGDKAGKTELDGHNQTAGAVLLSAPLNFINRYSFGHLICIKILQNQGVRLFTSSSIK